MNAPDVPHTPILWWFNSIVNYWVPLLLKLMLVMFPTKVPRTPEKVPRDPLGVPWEIWAFERIYVCWRHCTQRGCVSMKYWLFSLGFLLWRIEYYREESDRSGTYAKRFPGNLLGGCLATVIRRYDRANGRRRRRRALHSGRLKCINRARAVDISVLGLAYNFIVLRLLRCLPSAPSLVASRRNRWGPYDSHSVLPACSPQHVTISVLRQTTHSETRSIGSLVWSITDSWSPRFWHAVPSRTEFLRVVHTFHWVLRLILVPGPRVLFNAVSSHHFN